MFIIKEMIKRILYKLGWEISIDWSSRVRELGPESVYDSRTLKRKEITTDQNKVYYQLMNAELSPGKVKSVLDFGCGIGRHYKLLSSLNCLCDGAQILGFDPTTEMLEFAQKEPYFEVFDEFKYEHRYDLVFCHMVLGGLNDQDMKIALNDMVRSLSVDGRVFLVEAVNDDSPRLHSKWRARNSKSYMPESPGFEWTIAGEVFENDDCLKVFVGRKIG